MLKEHVTRASALPPMRVPEHRLWQDEQHHPCSLGCVSCPELRVCGGLSIEAGLMSCLDLCCRHPDSCDKPCRNNADYALRVREVGTFALDSVPRAAVLEAPTLPPVVPVLFHGKRRMQRFGPDSVALPLYAMFGRRDGRVRFESHEALCAEYCIAAGTQIILTGTDKDPPLERWWGYEGQRRDIIRALKELGVAFSTTPNFSLFVDVPRHVDLHAIKRIGLVHEEFLAEGIPTALHVNGRSEADFRRWGAYVRARPEVTHLAYEFATGTGRAARRELHAEWLMRVAKDAGRPINLVVRGGIDLLPRLAPAFDQVTVLETWSFMKTVNRQRAVFRADGSPRWRRAPSAAGEPLDALFAANRAVVRQWVEGRLPPRIREIVDAAE